MFRSTVAIAAAIAGSFALAVECAAPRQSPDEQMAGLLELSRPTPEHHMLDDLVGDFAFEVRFQFPGEAPSTWSGSSENRWVLGGRYLHCQSRSQKGDLVVESLKMLGFDARAREFTSTTFDTLATSAVQARGSFDRSTRTIAFQGENRDPKTGTRERFTEVLRIQDRDHYVREIWGLGGAGEPLKLVDASYTRGS